MENQGTLYFNYMLDQMNLIDIIQNIHSNGTRIHLIHMDTQNRMEIC